MSLYLILKYLHILSSVLMVGTGFGSAFYMYFTLRSRNVQAIAAVSRLVVRADTWFTTPTVVLQPLTGFWMLHILGTGLSLPWARWALYLYILAGLCWLPVVWLQLRLRDMAVSAVAESTALPALFWRYARYWEWLGYPAFVAMVIVYWLMVVKPV